MSSAISWVHLSGALHDTVAADPNQYLEPSPRLGEMLEQARLSGKKLFLMTNSSFAFADAGMRFLLGDQWQSLFDVVVTLAQKPAFYRRDSAFRVMSQHGFVKWSQAEHADVAKGRVLVGGSLRELARLTGWTGRQVLYVGDHLMADLAEPRRQAGWATAAIVRELEEELLIQTTEQYKDYHTRALAVSSMLRRLQSLDLPEEERDAALDALEALSVLLGGGLGSLLQPRLFAPRRSATEYAAARPGCIIQALVRSSDTMPTPLLTPSP